jgi:hypothetical protein
VSLPADQAITNRDVEEFAAALKEKNRNLTPEKARESLIRSGVLDSEGKPVWPIAKRTKTKASALRKVRPRRVRPKTTSKARTKKAG